MAQRKIKGTDKESRKDELDPSRDEFIARTMTLVDWAYERRRLIALALGTALVASVIGILVNHLRHKGRADESAVLAKGLTAASTPILGKDDEAKKAKDRLLFDDRAARSKESLKRFQAAAEQTGSAVEQVARLGEAVAHLDLEEYDKAILLFEKFLADAGSSLDFLKPNAIEDLGYALEGAGKPADATARFEKLLAAEQAGTGAVASMAKYHLARLCETKDMAKAAKLYKEIVDTFADAGKTGRDSYLFLRARERLIAVDPTAQVPDLPARGLNGLEGLDPEVLRQLMEAQAAGGASK